MSMAQEISVDAAIFTRSTYQLLQQHIIHDHAKTPAGRANEYGPRDLAQDVADCESARAYSHVCTTTITTTIAMLINIVYETITGESMFMQYRI